MDGWSEEMNGLIQNWRIELMSTNENKEIEELQKNDWKSIFALKTLTGRSGFHFFFTSHEIKKINKLFKCDLSYNLKLFIKILFEII